MNRMRILFGFVALLAGLSVSVETIVAQQGPPKRLAPYIKEDSPVLVLEHVRIIDGTGAAPEQDMRIDIEGGKISRVQSAKLHNAYPINAKVIDLTGKTVIPGMVGMHEHLFYPTQGRPKDGQHMYGEMADSAPRLTWPAA